MKTRLWFALGLLMTVFFVLNIDAGKRPPSPPPPPTLINPEIAYNIGGDLWVADAQGIYPTKILSAAGTDVSMSPDWGPDGKTIFFNGNPLNIGQGIYSISLDNYQIQLLRYGSGAPKVSPVDVLGTGHKVAYLVTDENDFHDIGLMNLDGSEPITLQTSDIDEVGVSWAPDGKRMAIMAVVNNGTPEYYYQLYIYELSYANGQFSLSKDLLIENSKSLSQCVWSNLPGTEQIILRTLQWIPDDRQKYSILNADLFVLDLDLSTLEQKHILSQWDDMDGLAIRDPSWSPGDTNLAFCGFTSDGRVKQASGIYIMKPDAFDAVNNVPQLLIPGEVRFFSWYSKPAPTP